MHFGCESRLNVAHFAGGATTAGAGRAFGGELGDDAFAQGGCVGGPFGDDGGGFDRFEHFGVGFISATALSAAAFKAGA